MPTTATIRFLAAPGKAGFAPDGVTVVGTIVFARIERITPCFAPGTMILTDQGEVAVGALGRAWRAVGA